MPTHAINFYDFKILSLNEKADILWEHGEFIVTRKTETGAANLYTLLGFFVELQYNGSLNNIEKIQRFTSYRMLGRYLDKIDLVRLKLRGRLDKESLSLSFINFTKTKIVKTALLTILTFTSLTIFAQSQTIYQVSVWTSESVKSEGSEGFKFANDDLEITYDFWSGSREISFSIFNKTNQAITIDWTKSHFILWNYSNDFFNGRESTFTSSNLQRSSSYGSSKSTSSEEKIVIKDRKETHIPPHSMISESFQITNTLYFDCSNYFKKMNKGEVIKVDFTETSTPYKLRNYLTYLTTEGENKTIDNDFRINQVMNMNSSTFEGKTIKEETCNQYGAKSTKVSYSMPYMKTNRQYEKITPPSSCFCF